MKRIKIIANSLLFLTLVFCTIKIQAQTDSTQNYDELISPTNMEVAAMYSLSLIGSVPVGRNTEVYEHAAKISKEVLNNNPKHPGALHYLIHAYDDPEHAAMDKSTADKYSVVAPAAGHALHMPTHIYLSLVLWDNVISSNIDSWKAGQEYGKKVINPALSPIPVTFVKPWVFMN